MLDVIKNILIYGGSFVVVLSLVVFVHEFGHFQVARWRKVAIDAFSIGFGKRLAGWRDKQGVEWKIGALPLGGYVKFTGDADAASTGPAEAFENSAAREAARRQGLFHAQPLLTRSLVVAAGPVSNFIFAILVFALVLMMVGRDTARIDLVSENSPAAEAGFMPGDEIVAINGEEIMGFGALLNHVAQHGQSQIDFTVERGGALLDISATPRVMDPDGDGPAQARPLLGLTHNDDRAQYVGVNPVEAVGLGAAQTWMIVASTFTYIADVVTGRQSGEHIAGPVGIMQQSGQIAESALDQPDGTLFGRLGDLAFSLLQWAAILSVAVGIVNLLPIPILDGGHLMFYAIEALRGGKPLPPMAQEWAFRAGALVMMTLFLFATWNDVARGFTGS